MLSHYVRAVASCRQRERGYHSVSLVCCVPPEQSVNKNVGEVSIEGYPSVFGLIILLIHLKDILFLNCLSGHRARTAPWPLTLPWAEHTHPQVRAVLTGTLCLRRKDECAQSSTTELSCNARVGIVSETAPFPAA